MLILPRQEAVPRLLFCEINDDRLVTTLRVVMHSGRSASLGGRGASRVHSAGGSPEGAAERAGFLSDGEKSFPIYDIPAVDATGLGRGAGGASVAL